MVIKTDPETMYLGVKNDGTPFRVFIVDDSAFMVKTISKLLTGFGCKVVGSANDGEDAVNQIQQKKEEIDLITLDISMPKKDGLTALPELLKAKANLMVIMVSAMGDKEKVKTAIMSGAKHFIVKPFKKEKVYDICRWVLEKNT